jgi:Tfp pilus assembly protein PilF
MATDEVAEGLRPDDVRGALDIVLASDLFKSSPQLAAFLRFIVEATLRGEGDRIKGYTIAVEALGRQQDFDPQIDPIVRVEATRLRRTLERYYAGPGANDRIVFELSRGSYVPAIRRRDPGVAFVDVAKSRTWRLQLPSRRAQIIAAAGIAGVLIVAAAAWIWRSDRQVADMINWGTSARSEASAPLRPGNGMPVLVIDPVTVLDLAPAAGATRTPLLVKPLTEKLRTAVAAFETVNVTSTPRIDIPAAGPAPQSNDPQTDYRLIGTGELLEDKSVNVQFRLIDVAQGTVIWSRTFGPLALNLDYAPAEQEVVRDVTMALAPPFGVIRARERVKYLTSSGGDPRARCIVEASESFRSFDSQQQARAQSCLETLTQRDPAFALGFAYLAAVYMREFQYGLDQKAGNASLLDRALQLARHAIELTPESARAYQMLFTVLFARRDLAAAFAAGDKAVALNPLDMTIRSDYGGRLILTGELDRGMEMLMWASDQGAVRPSWYHFYIFLGSYLKGDKGSAEHHASQITADVYPFGLLARTLVAAMNGNRQLAQTLFAELAAKRPQWRSDLRGELARLFPTPDIVNRLTQDIASAVLPALN